MRIADYSGPIQAVYAKLVDMLLVNIAGHFNISAMGNTPTYEWEIAKLSELGQLSRENAAIIARTVAQNEPMIELALQQTMLDVLGKMGGTTLRTTGMSWAMQNILRHYSGQALTQTNLVNTVMLSDSLTRARRVISRITENQRYLRDVTQGVLNIRTGQVVTGITSRQQAARMALQDMAKEGITGFIDKAGHHWSPEAYAAMDIRTTTNNVAREAVFQEATESGHGLIVWPINATARPGCYPWQGKVCSVFNQGGHTTDLHGNRITVYPLNQTSYGEPDGIGGINCHHTPPDPFVPGLSVIRGAVPPRESNDALYAQSQKHRYLERQVRDAKREAICLDAAGDAEGFAEAARKVKERQAQLAGFAQQTGRTLRSDRTQVHGYNRSMSGRARAS